MVLVSCSPAPVNINEQPHREVGKSKAIGKMRNIHSHGFYNMEPGRIILLSCSIKSGCKLYFVNTTFVFNNIYHGNYFETDLIGACFYVMQILFIQRIILIVRKTILVCLLSYISVSNLFLLRQVF